MLHAITSGQKVQRFSTMQPLVGTFFLPTLSYD